MQLIWEEFLKIIKEEAGSQVVETWFKAVTLDYWDHETRTVHLLMPNQFVSKWIQEHYAPLIKTHLSRLLHVDTIRLFFKNASSSVTSKHLTPASSLQKHLNLSDTSTQISPASPSSSYSLTSTPSRAPTLWKKEWHKRRGNTGVPINTHYTFDSFVVGPTNSLAHAAAVAVSQNVGKVYNPLFIYGGTGLGKTHLMHAIGNNIRENYPNTKIYYETSDNFINEFINAIKSDRVKQFREKYLKVHLLLLDDVQFFSHKEQTQEALFHIFDALHSQQKQIVLSSDTLPQHIMGLQHRIKSRLQSGLIADVHMPTQEMKIAIITKKATLNKIALDESVTRFLASQPVSSIRELEGYLIRLAAYASLTNQSITFEIAKRIVSQFHTKQTASTSSDRVLKIVSEHFDVTIADLRSKQRSKTIAQARQIAFHLLKKHTNCSLQMIGNSLGGRNHSTVLHAIHKIDYLLNQNQELQQKVQQIEQSLFK